METYAVGSTAATTPSIDRSGFNSMSSEDFFELLVTELQQQDPLEPTDTSDMLGQVSQIRTIEQSTQLMTTLEQLTQQQRTAGASDLLGKFVEAFSVDDEGTVSAIGGVVTSVRFGSDGVAVLELDTGQQLSANDVTRICTVEQAELSAVSDDESDDSADKSEATARSRSGALGIPGLSLNSSLSL